jgi:biotin carboxyl carrier protein
VQSLALDLYAKVLAAQTLQAAAHALVRALAAPLGLRAATIALRVGGHTRVLASSPGDMTRPQPDLANRLVGAMDEAIEQSVSLCWPPERGGSGAQPGQAASEQAQDTIGFIRIEHQALHALVGNPVASIPLGRDGVAFGALSVQSAGAVPFDAVALRNLEQLMGLAAPALRWMQHSEESSVQRLWRDLRQAWETCRQPDRATRRRLIIAGALLVGFLAVAPLPRDVGGRARVEGAEQRQLVAPTDGFIKAAHVRPGDRVKAGQPLVDLLDGDLRLERERWASQLAQHENAYAAAMAKADRTAASTSMARIAEAHAQLALVDEQLTRGRVAAPFDALVIQGDLSQSIGAPVRQGDTLLTLATTGRQRVIVEVDEVDIERIRVGQPGRLSLSSLPWDRQDVLVERITPLAKAVDGRNVFEVEARLVAPRADIRPGLLGRADITVGRLPPLWAWTQQALARARVAWWAWLG